MRLAALTLLLALLVAAAPLRPLDEDGYRRVLTGNKGQVVLVNFWATYCAPCRKEMPALAALAKRLKARGFLLVVISADEPAQEKAAQAFMEKQAVTGPTYIRKAQDDDTFIRAIDAKWSGALPASFLYDRAGTKVKSFVGEVEISELEREIARVL
ncbi:MAG: TlpA disulfide reductase family protein [Acidobacteria bacterium]|nr:TlpA disulfide reductase family protein [Acidobacteriota bacterium]